MKNLLKKLFIIPLLCLAGTACTEETVVASPTSARTMTGCVVVSDDYGDREVCDTQYYYADGGVVYWDAAFGIWVGPGGYWHGGRWYRGYHPGWRGYYGRGWYHPHGWYHGHEHSFHGQFHGGYHRGGARGGFHGGRR